MIHKNSFPLIILITIFSPAIIAYLLYHTLINNLDPKISLFFIGIIFLVLYFVLEYFEPFKEKLYKNFEEIEDKSREYSILSKKNPEDNARYYIVQKILGPWGELYESFKSLSKDSPLETLFKVIDFREKIVSRVISREWQGSPPKESLFLEISSLNKAILQKMPWSNKMEDFAEETKDYWIKTSLRIDNEGQVVPMTFIDDPKERDKIGELIKQEESLSPYGRYSKFRSTIINRSREFLKETKPHDELSFFGLSIINETLWMLEDCPLIIGKNSKIRYYNELFVGIDLISKGMKENRLEYVIKGAAVLMSIIDELENITNV